MFNNTDDETDGQSFKQPTNESWPARLARLPGMDSIPGVGDSTGTRTQDLVQLSHPYRGECAIEDDDGSLIAAVEVEPANMALSDSDTWEKSVKSLADALANTVTYRAQWYSPMRSVDYDDRRTRYKDRELGVRRSGDMTMADHLRADIWEERAAVVDLYQQTTLTREYYMLVKVTPSEGVVETSDEDGGLASVPGLGKLITKKELRERSGSAELTNELLDKLQRRVKELETALGQIEGLSAYRVSSYELAKVAADYYRTTDIWARSDFKDLLRGAPTPGDLEDPEHELDYSHVTQMDAPMEAVSTDGGTQTQQSTDVDDGWEFDAGAINSDHAAGIVADEDDLSEQFKAVMAPDVFDRSDPDHIMLDDEAVETTINLRDWPGDPQHGLLENVLNYGLPGVEVTVSTSIEYVDEQTARREMADAVDALEMKAEDAQESKWNPFASKYEKDYRDAQGVLDALEESDYGLFNTNTYITIRAPDTDQLETAESQIRSRLQDANVSAKPMKFNHDVGYQMTAPTVPDDAYEPVKMLGNGLAALFPWSTRNLNETSGIEVGEHAYSGEPTVLDLFSRGTGYNFGIYGNIGSGKTTTAKEIAFREKTKNPDMKLVLIDPLQEFTGVCEAFDGEHIVVGGNTNINVMHIEPTPKDRLRQIGKETPFNDTVAQVMGTIGNYYHIEGLSGFEDKQGTWKKAIREAYDRKGITKDPSTHDRESPTLTDVFDVLREMVTNPGKYVDDELDGDEDAVQDRKMTAIDIVNNDLEAFEDEYVNLTRQSNISFSDADVIYLDLQRYENQKERGALLMELLLKEMYEKAKDTTDEMMMLIDEAHYMLKNSENLESLKQAHRHSRHHDLAIGLCTQTVSEFFAKTSDGGNALTESAKVIFKNQSVQVYHYLKEISEYLADLDADDSSKLGLTSEAIQYIDEADPGKAGKGWAEGLLHVDQEGSYPLRVRMSDDLNPREFALYEYDASKHGDLQEYLSEYRDKSEANWTWGWD